jgi:hypothetical protein
MEPASTGRLGWGPNRPCPPSRDGVGGIPADLRTQGSHLAAIRATEDELRRSRRHATIRSLHRQAADLMSDIDSDPIRPFCAPPQRRPHAPWFAGRTLMKIQVVTTSQNQAELKSVQQHAIWRTPSPRATRWPPKGPRGPRACPLRAPVRYDGLLAPVAEIAVILR